MNRVLSTLVLLAAACGAPQATMTGGGFRVSGPYAHENLAVYLVHSDIQESRDFITLDEGLKSGAVKVTEKGQEQVSELLLENGGDVALFVQEGDRVKGGKQDRIVGLSFVVPPRSGPQPIPSFCVERGRWEGSAKGFQEGSNGGLASKEVRAAAKVSKSQQEVWKEVDTINRAAPDRIGNSVDSTSLNETADSPEARKAVEPFMKSLAAVLDKHSNAVGVAFALNGTIEEVNVYPGHKLAKKLYPRLLESYALSAVLNRKPATAPTAAEVTAFMKEGTEKKRHSQEAVGNRVTLCDYDKQVRCQTEFGGAVVHSQWMRMSEGSGIQDSEQRQQVEQQERR
jgi:hypothetical protein